jgi:hypothetical protein
MMFRIVILHGSISQKTILNIKVLILLNFCLHCRLLMYCSCIKNLGYLKFVWTQLKWVRMYTVVSIELIFLEIRAADSGHIRCFHLNLHVRAGVIICICL